VLQAGEQTFSTGTVLPIGRRDHHGQHQPSRIDEDGALAALDLFVGIIAVDPPFSVVLTDWLSMLAALGWRGRPAATRTSPRRRSCITAQVPSLRHCQQ
jgi:hypothetical protein